MRKDLKNWKVYWPENGRKGQSSERVPHYCRKADEWRCMVEGCFGHRYEERGSLEYVMGEFAGYNETYDFNIKENEDREGGWQDHEHSFEGVLISLLKHPEHFSIDGFEEQYSIQQMELLKAVKKKLLAMGRDNDDSKDSAIAEWESWKLRAKYLNAILFPSDYFDPSEVDPDLKAEYAAVNEDKMLTPILFNYEAWFEHACIHGLRSYRTKRNPA